MFITAFANSIANANPPQTIKSELWEVAADMNGDGVQNAIEFALMRKKLLEM